MKKIRFLFLLISALIMYSLNGYATKLVDVKVVHDKMLMVHFKDGTVEFRDDAQGVDAYWGHPGPNSPNQDEVIYYGSALNTGNAQNTNNWTLKSSNDGNFGGGGKKPTNAHRKSKVDGVSRYPQGEGTAVMAHWIFLPLPNALQQGKSYTLEINSNTNTDVTSYNFTYDIYSADAETEAIKLNLAGYTPSQMVKSADIYEFLGDGGHANFSAYEGNDVIAYNVNTGDSYTVGSVNFWKGEGVNDVYGKKIIKSPVWNCDISALTASGTYRIVIPGIGCSKEFNVSEDALFDPYRMALRGYYYMRMGQKDVNGIEPVPRIPLMIPGDQSDGTTNNTTVYITTYHPFGNMPPGGGDQWDAPGNWANGVTGETSQAWGGYSDAFDWDRHSSHVGNIYDILLPYILHQGQKLNDDNMMIAESGDGIPDLLQTAQWEVDFWLRVREPDGSYGSGLTNPLNYKSDTYSGTIYQAASHPVMAWANAANCAMMAEAYRLAGNSTLSNYYKNEAITAYKFNSNPNDGLSTRYTIVKGEVWSGGDFKMLAASFLYNLTGDTKYEQDMASLSVVSSTSPDTQTNLEYFNEGDPNNTYNQLYAAVGYLFTNRTVNYPTLKSNFKASIINQAKNTNLWTVFNRPSRRATINEGSHGFWQTNQQMQRAVVAHAISDNVSEKNEFLESMLLETDFGLGRNPLSKIQMTGPVGTHYIENAYVTGRNDGTPGIHYGITPYLYFDCWWGSEAANADWGYSGCARWYSFKDYPGGSNWSNAWPEGQAYWNSRYLCPTTEYTPRQTMKGKTALYAYLYGLGATGCETTYELSSSATNGSVTPSQGNYCANSEVTLTAEGDFGYAFSSWSGDASGSTNPLTVTMNSAKNITANFTEVDTYTLTIISNNGTVTANPNNNNLQYSAGDQVSLTTDPNDGYSFVEWSGDVTGISSSIDVTMDSDKTVTAVFEANNMPEGTAQVDGTKDGVYSSAYSIANDLIGSAAASDLSASWSAAWDADILYIYVEVTDDDKQADSGTDWPQDDVVEIYIDSDNSKNSSYDGTNDYQYGFVWNSSDDVKAGGSNPANSTAGINYTFTNPGSTSYVLEAAIPWSTLNATPALDAVIGMDVHVIDDDEGGSREAKKAWSTTTDDSWSNPSLFGDVVLSSATNGNLTPTASAGNDQVITLPTNSVSADNAIASGGDGTLTYSWAETSSLGSTISGGNSLTPTFNNLVEGTYTFTLTVEDEDGDQATDNMTVTVNAAPGESCTADGTILYERYDAITGTAISNLTGAAKYPDSPDYTEQLTSFEAPSAVNDDYGVRMSGYLCAPTTGDYTFWVAGDDNVEFSISTDSDPANKSSVAYHTGWTFSQEWNKYTTQKSTAITLTAGNTYYLEALMKEGSGGDRLAVGWAKPGESTTAPSEVIPGSVLSATLGGGGTPDLVPTANAGSNKSITLPTNSVSVTDAGASGGDGTLTYSWAETSSLGSNISNGNTLSPTFSNLVEGTYTFELTVTDGDGDQATDQMNVTVAPEASGCTSCGSGFVDFCNANFSSYSDQDKNPDLTVVDGCEVALGGNTWKKVDFSYTITADTYVEFEFMSTDEGEIHGLGFDDDNTHTEDRIFQVYGTQDAWGIAGYENYSGSNWKTYTINVGAHFTGTVNYLTLTNDNDSGTGNSSFRNIRVYEATTDLFPTANAGSNKSITLPTNSVSVTNAGASGGDGTLTYSWAETSSLGSSISNGNSLSPTFSNLVEGSYTFELTVTDGDGDQATDQMNVTVAPEPTGSSDIPGTIEAEAYDRMSGIQTQTTSDQNGGGDNVGWIDNGDWMEYDVSVASTNSYDVNFRLATPRDNASFNLESNGTVIASVNVPNTGNWQNWTDVTATVSLSSGSQTLRVVSTSNNGWNFNYMVYVENTTTTPQHTLTTSATTGGSVAPSGSNTYDANTAVTLTATEQSGYTFSGWSGDASGSTNPLTVTMDGNKTITANFTQNQTGQTIRYQAEDATLSGNSTVATIWSGYDGTGYVKDFTSNGDKVTFDVSGITAGTYDLTIRYAVCQGQQMFVLINGAGASGGDGTISFLENTGGCGTSSDWDDLVLSNVSLNANNTIVYEKKTGYTPIDYIEISPSGTNQLKSNINTVTDNASSIHVSTFSVYPNPVSGNSFYVESDVQHMDLKVYNMQGQKVFESLFKGDQMEISTREFDSGVYMIKLGSELKKLIIE